MSPVETFQTCFLFCSSKRYVVVGVVSIGDECALPGHAGVYARVTTYLDWINENIAVKWWWWWWWLSYWWWWTLIIMIILWTIHYMYIYYFEVIMLGVKINLILALYWVKNYVHTATIILFLWRFFRHVWFLSLYHMLVRVRMI